MFWLPALSPVGDGAGRIQLEKFGVVGLFLSYQTGWLPVSVPPILI